MTDAVDGNANTIQGDNKGTSVQAQTMRDVYLPGSGKKSSLLARAAIVLGVVAALTVAVAAAVYLKNDDQPAAPATTVVSAPPSLATTTPAPSPPTSTSDVTTGTVPTGVPRTTAPPPRPTTVAQPAPPAPQPAPVKPATDGPGYLVPAGNAQRAADFYQNSWNDVVMWERHPASDGTSFQPFWAREFPDANPSVFRIRNQRGNLCMEPVYQENFGEHIKANACSWGNDAQLWQTVNTSQVAHVASGRCLGTANGSYDNGTWLIASLCTGSDDQKWRISR
ncbi:ricin-type beta-trefoil lectin domain protein [Lentzea sp. NPDC058436]|uniref:ricin-type beta-trefoil lectin domain protein n=1 Tax=Lentzea sp. NPDC058436 TaxID=3346499 RepID=UPI00364CB7B3